MDMKKYDAIVIGSGQAGTPLSKALAESGLKTALIEERWVGGTCVNDGCSPTKAMIASARLAYMIGKSQDLGITTEKPGINISSIVDRKDKIVHRMRANSEEGILETKNLDLLYGTATFSGKNEIKISLQDGGEQVLSANHIFINTGAKPNIPEISGISNIDYLTSTTILNLREIPEHLLIIGAGYVGMEFGQMFRRFGSKVTMIEKAHRIMLKEDEDISAEMNEILSAEGIKILTDCQIKRLAKIKDGIRATIEIDKKEKTISCSHVLIATGRQPQSEKLNLESAGVTTSEKGYIKVDAFLQTSAKGIFALGDVNGGPPFTHIAYDDYRIVIHNMTNKNRLSTKDRLLPYCMFTDPQLGRIGITEQEAKRNKLDIRVASMPNSVVARAIETGDTRGLMKAVVDAKSGKILGASILGSEGGEIATVLQMAMMGGITWMQIRDSVFAHPTFSESLNNLFMFPEA
jgi:pyruvate/2-oxoglutarate dehydrogenase complex dihydrolipoamide dehydrogenase (E3) component